MEEDMMIYPRHQLDIEFCDLSAGCLSYFTRLNRQQLEKEILSFWQDKKHSKICFTVRTALDSFLSALKLPEDSEVLMSAININDMVQIVKNHGLKVIPVDLQVKDMSLILDNFEKLVSDKTKVLIFAQLFGAVIDLKTLSEICKKYNILLIEDCAQAFCGTKYQGSLFADISLFSFGTIKSSTALGGAIVVSKSMEYIKKIELIECNYEVKGELWFFRKILKYLFIKLSLSPILYGVWVKLLVLIGYDLEETINEMSRSFAKGQLSSQIRFQPPIHLLFLLRKRLRDNNDIKFDSREREALIFLERLECFVEVPSKKARFHSFWVIPVLTDNPVSLQKILLQCGFDTTLAKHSQTVINSMNDAYAVKNAKYIMDKIVYLPTIKGMMEKDKKRLISILKANIEKPEIR